MLKMTANVLRDLFSKKPTRLYPAEVRTPFETMRGVVVNEIENCNFCSICAVKCPSQCISVDKKATTWTWDPFACVYCGICVEACPSKCLHQKQAHRQPAYERQVLLEKRLGKVLTD